MKLFETVTDVAIQADVLRRRRYGVIEMIDGKLHRIVLRPFPKFATLAQVLWGQWYHDRLGGDRWLLYCNQMRRGSIYLWLKYIVSGKRKSFA